MEKKMKEMNRNAMMDTIREQPGLIRELYEKKKRNYKGFRGLFQKP